MASPTAAATIDIDAPADLVYDIISDIERLPEWAAETASCRWISLATGPAVGARFRGTNAHNGRRWGNECVVTDVDPGRRFGWHVTYFGRPSASWRYEVEPTDTGCRVTESTRRLVPKAIAGPVNLLLGITDRDEHNQRNIERTLASLKEHAERAAARA